ncbi:hypothetical protein H4219_001905 [Mycoemilia scoparia]|uniref:Thioredoxin domain-containing protein n=1 Tax=Mycoemilia scoparia TaxID=417184 RepID=A0A9W8A5G9_9FUNG|nr:hypothetical protein H4219_001905 [Mycoemilia scoparia]
MGTIKNKIESQAQRVLDDGSDALSEDELLQELELDPEFEKLREMRLQQLKNEMDNMQKLKSEHHGEYTEIIEEKDMVVLPVNTKQPVIAHFYHKDFTRCKIIDSHLEKLAPRHFKTRFVKANVEKMPFLVQKLGVRVLPCIVVFKGNKVVDRIVGFEELGNVDDFKTQNLEKRLAKGGAIKLDEGESSAHKYNQDSIDKDEDYYYHSDD